MRYYSTILYNHMFTSKSTLISSNFSPFLPLSLSHSLLSFIAQDRPNRSSFHLSRMFQCGTSLLIPNINSLLIHHDFLLKHVLSLADLVKILIYLFLDSFLLSYDSNILQGFQAWHLTERN